MELCSSTATLGSLTALHFLDYLSNVATPADGFMDLALELVKLGRVLLDTRAALTAASQNTRYALNVPAIRQRLTQAKSSVNLLDHFVKKLVASQHKKGLSKMSQGFRMLFADTDLTKYTSSLILSREALATAIGTDFHGYVEHETGMTVGYQALAAVLGSDIFSTHTPSHADSQSDLNVPRSRNSSLPGPLSPTRGPVTETSLSAVSERPETSLAHLQPLKHDSAYGSTGRPKSVVEEEFPSHAVHFTTDPAAVVRLVPRNRGGPVTPAQEASLVAAVSQKNYRLAEQLLDKGVNPNASESLLMVSIAHHDLDTLRCLLMFGADANTFDSEGLSPLYAAVQVSFMAGAQMLINYGADVNVSVGLKQENALALALTTGKTPFVQLLLKYCADPDYVMDSGFTPLTRAIDETLPLAMIDLLFLYGAEPDRKNRRGESALFKAISAGRLDIVTTLLEHGADPNLPAPKHMLWPAVHYPRILEMLLEHGADLKRAPGVLELATSINSLEAVQILLKYGVDVNAKKDGIFTPLCTAIRDDRAELLDILIAAGADPNLPASEYPAFKCVTHHRAHLLPRILEAGADPNAPAGIAETAVASNNKDALKILLQHDVNINARSSSTGETALTKAISMQDIPLIDLLLANGADPAVRGHEWPVAMAVKNPDILARLLPHIATSKIIKGAMEMAVVANQIDSVKLLLAKGIDVEDKNGGVFSPLTTSIREDRKDIFRYLLDHANADPNAPGEHLPIIKAIRRHRDGDLSYIRHLLTKGADINLMYRGWNAVLQAIDNGDVKVLQLLVDWAPPNLAARDESGLTVYEVVKERGLDEEEKILCGRGQPSPDIADATARLRDVALAL